MYIPYLQFKYRLSLFYLNSCLLSHLRHLHLLRLSSEIQDRIYCGRSIKAEAKVRSNSAITDHHRHHQSKSDLCSGTILTDMTKVDTIPKNQHMPNHMKL